MTISDMGIQLSLVLCVTSYCGNTVRNLFLVYTCQGKVFTVHIKKAYRWSRGIALLISERFISCPGHFSPRKELQYPLNWRLGRPQSQSPYFAEEKNFVPLLGSKPQTYTYVPCCSYTVKIFKIICKNGLAKFCYMATYMTFIS